MNEQRAMNALAKHRRAHGVDAVAVKVFVPSANLKHIIFFGIVKSYEYLS